MKTSYTGILERISVGDGNYYSVLPKETFMGLLDKGYSRKKATKLGIGSRLWNNSYEYHLTKESRAKSRNNRLRDNNSKDRLIKWDAYLVKLEGHFPGLTKTFKDNLKDNPEVINQALGELNDFFYETKDFIRVTKKWVRQACNRKGIKPIKLVSNLSEYRLKRLLKELGYTPEVQPYIDNKFYDFRVGDCLIEFDGAQFHTDEKDDEKDRLAASKGLRVLRIGDDELMDLVFLGKKLGKCLGEVK